jgi:predicted glycosyltransferase involved in capsule biosynthesis
MNRPLESEDVADYVGMVYLLENTTNGRKYVGKKFFHRNKSFQVNKKKKKKRVESDWKDYYGSSKELLADIEKVGKDKIKRTVLHLCKSKTQCSYYEMVEQIERKVLLTEDYYNGFIGGKISGKFLESLE